METKPTIIGTQMCMQSNDLMRWSAPSGADTPWRRCLQLIGSWVIETIVTVINVVAVPADIRVSSDDHIIGRR